MKYPLVRRRRSRDAVMALVPTYDPGTTVLLYKDRKLILCTTADCEKCEKYYRCVLRGTSCGLYTNQNRLIPLEDAL